MENLISLFCGSLKFFRDCGQNKNSFTGHRKFTLISLIPTMHVELSAFLVLDSVPGPQCPTFLRFSIVHLSCPTFLSHPHSSAGCLSHIESHEVWSPRRFLSPCVDFPSYGALLHLNLLLAQHPNSTWILFVEGLIFSSSVKSIMMGYYLQVYPYNTKHNTCT